MSLTWTQPEAIANCLEEAYPEAEVMDIEHAELVLLVSGLREFDHNAATPREEQLDAVLFIWNSLRG
jgi:FeS assembly protein IscX